METEKKTKTFGLCLGAGGAKGMAHLGVLKAFEEENIKFDMVAGASIGSIIGGLYCNGYSVANVSELLSQMGKTQSQSALLMRLSLTGAEPLIRRFIGDLYFDDLSLPFSCVAVDMYKGEVVTLNKGSLALAMSASSAILPAFRPVEIDGRYLIDGAYMNAVPADVLKGMGADVIVSVNLSGNNNLNTHSKPALDAMYPGNKVPVCNRLRPMYDFSDVILTPDLSDYNAMSFEYADEIYAKGYRIAKEQMQKIKELLQ